MHVVGRESDGGNEGGEGRCLGGPLGDTVFDGGDGDWRNERVSS